VRTFDRKFGADFLAGVPSAPGVYHLYDAADALLYVGKAGDLRRRLAQYRTTRRTKKDHKRRALVRSAHRIVWQVCASELEASLTEIRLIQALRPRENVAGAFPFLYPFIRIALLRGASREALERLALRLLDHAGARARRAEIQEDLRAIERFFDDEASPLASEPTGTPDRHDAQ
jgi:excinuclease ABC subunit C